jgi:hypothetical protein
MTTVQAEVERLSEVGAVRRSLDRVRQVRAGLEARRATILGFATDLKADEPTGDAGTVMRLLRDPAAVESIPAEAIPRVLGVLRMVEVVLLAKLGRVGTSGPDGPGTVREDRLLTAAEAAKVLRLSVDYLYRHASRLPFAVRPTPRSLRFSSQGIDQYIERSLQGSRGGRKATQKPLGGARP